MMSLLRNSTSLSFIGNFAPRQHPEDWKCGLSHAIELANRPNKSVILRCFHISFHSTQPFSALRYTRMIAFWVPTSAYVVLQALLVALGSLRMEPSYNC